MYNTCTRIERPEDRIFLGGSVQFAGQKRPHQGQRPVKVLASTFYPLHFFVPCLSCSPFLLSLRLYSSSTLNLFPLVSLSYLVSFFFFLFFSSFPLHLCTFPIFFDAYNFDCTFVPFRFFILSSSKFLILNRLFAFEIFFELIFYFQIFLRIF